MDQCFCNTFIGFKKTFFINLVLVIGCDVFNFNFAVVLERKIIQFKRPVSKLKIFKRNCGILAIDDQIVRTSFAVNQETSTVKKLHCRACKQCIWGVGLTTNYDVSICVVSCNSRICEVNETAISRAAIGENNLVARNISA